MMSVSWRGGGGGSSGGGGGGRLPVVCGTARRSPAPHTMLFFFFPPSGPAPPKRRGRGGKKRRRQARSSSVSRNEGPVRGRQRDRWPPLHPLRAVKVAAVRLGGERAAPREVFRGLQAFARQAVRGDGALPLVPGGAALDRDGGGRGGGSRIDREDVVERAHVEPHTAGRVGVAALAVAAAGDRHLEPALTGVAQHGPELLHLPHVLQARDASGREARDVRCEQRILDLKQVSVGNDECAGVQGEGEEQRGGSKSHPTDRASLEHAA